MRTHTISAGNPKLEGKLSEVYSKSLGRKAELEGSSLSPQACFVALTHAESMLDLLHAILRRDWAFAHDLVVLSRLFPCTAAGLKTCGAEVQTQRGGNAGVSPAEKTEDAGTRGDGDVDGSESCGSNMDNLAGVLVGLHSRDFEMLKARSLFLRSIDAAVECMLVFFGMESAIEGGEGTAKRLVYRSVRLCLCVCVCVFNYDACVLCVV
jgi:hypothetical protein